MSLTLTLENGWNFVSLNVLPDDTSISSILPFSKDGDLVKNQTASTRYYGNAGIWYGTFDRVSPQSAYKIFKNDASQVTVTGTSASHVIVPIYSGWNMIPYLLSDELPLPDALSPDSMLEGDTIKSQTSSARVYKLASGDLIWYGTLDRLRPGEGYMLQSGLAFGLSYGDRRRLSRLPGNVAAYGGYTMSLIVTGFVAFAVVRRNVRSDNTMM